MTKKGQEKIIKNVLLYTRVSTEMQVEGYSLEAQLLELRKYCNNNGYTIIGEYQDAGISGTSVNKRTQFKEMMREVIQNPLVDAVIGWKLSRISRNMIDLVEMIEVLQKHNVGLITITDQINTLTPAGKTFCYLAGIFAEMERDNIVEQAKNGMKQRARNGLHNGGIPPYGYVNNKDGKGLVVNDDAAKVIRKIYELYTEKEWGYSKIVNLLNRDPEKYPSPRGKGWSYQSVQKVLDNPTYCGYVRWGVFEGWNENRRKGETEDYIVAKGQHVPIISKEMFDRTQERRKKQSVDYAPTKRKDMKYLLSGLAKCPKCGASMITQRSQRNTKDGKVWYRYYGCSQWASKKGDVCKQYAVRADVLEERIIARIKEFAKHPRLPELIAARIGKENSTAELEAELKLIDKEIAKLTADETKLYGYLTDDEKLKVLSEEKLLEMIGKTRNSIESKKIEREQIAAKLANQHNLEMDISKIAAILQNFDEVFDKAPFEAQKNLLHALIKEIKIKMSENIDERLEEAVILRFTDLDLMNHVVSEQKEKTFEVNDDTVHCL